MKGKMAAGAVLFAFVSIGCGAASDPSPGGGRGDGGDVLSAAEGRGGDEFDLLRAAFEEAGLADTLGGDEPVTLFAPTDAAFERLPDEVLAGLLADTETLERILRYHMVEGVVRAEDLAGETSVKTLEGSELMVDTESGGVVLDGLVQVTRADIEAHDSVVHVIDAVLLPPDLPFPGDLVEAVSAYPILDTLANAVAKANLVTALQGDNAGQGYTLFTPTNRAFEELGIDLGTLTEEQLQDVLLFHVLGDTVLASEIAGMDSATTLQGGEVTIDVDESGSVLLDGKACVVRTDLRTENGVIHVIDAVLTP